jgi:tetratricopeptide (TPR) repeat protein
MDCAHIEREEIAEKYLSGRLNADEQESYERHYFGCPECFAGLEALRAVRDELAARRGSLEDASARRPVAWKWAWAGGLAAVAVLVTIVVTQLPPSAPPPAPPPIAASPSGPLPQAVSARLEELARYEPPAYAPVVLRGTADESAREFRAAMEHYLRRDYRAAIPRLERAVRFNERGADASFYLAACRLLLGETDAAIAGFRRTIALGDTPYLEEAQFGLAKAHLKKQDLDAALRALRQVIELRGELQASAEKLRHEVEELRGPRP